MGRRELRDEIQARWVVLEPRKPGTPFRKKDIDDSVHTSPVSDAAVESSEESVAPRCPRDSTAASEGG
jgi:hypothetical protein